MPTKRGHPEGGDTAGAVGPSGKTAAQEDAHSAAAGESSARRTRPNEAYTTYEQVHLATVGLRRGRATAAAVHECASRALATVNAGGEANNSAVRQAAVLLARQVCAYPEADTGGIVGGLVQTLGTAAPATRSEIYGALERIHEVKGIFSAGGSAAVPDPTMRRLDAAVRRDLNHAQHHLRCAALAVLALVWMRTSTDDGRGAGLFDVVCRYTADSHPKVRQTALATLARHHTVGARLAVDTYDDCVVATKDDYEQVRLAAVELVWMVGTAYPDHPVVIHKHGTTDTIRLLDDAFVKICDMVNDCSVVVRQRACAMLGRFTNVDAKFLSQTFSKQVMSNLRRFAARAPRGYAGRNRGVRTGGGGGRAAIPTPEGDADVESDEFRLLDSGAAGAFVHGLEDEYQEVRDAAIESITELCAASADFSAKAVDFLVDMFNDSSDRVRACAIHALTSIGDRALIQITEEQLSIALSAMKDSSSRVRAGIYRFLSVATLARAEWIERLVAGFRANLERYAHDDQHAIYATLRMLGQNHSHIVSIAFARSLLGISEHYLSREARIDDAVYAGNVILLMNTKPPSRAAIAAALPDYVSTHLPYLRDKYPGCLPADIADSVPPRLGFVKQMLSRPQPDLSIAQLTLANSQKHVDGAFAAIVSALEQAAGDAGGDTAGVATLLARRARELEALCTGDPAPDRTEPDERHLAVAHYARLVGHILDTQTAAAAAAPVLPSPQRPRQLDLAARVMRGAYELAGRTAGLDTACKHALSDAQTFAHAAWLAAHDLAAYDRRLADKMVRELLRRMRGAATHCAGPRLSEPVRRLEEAWLAVPSTSNDGDGGRSADPGGIRSDSPLLDFERELAAFVAGFRPMPFMPPGLCRRARARIASQ
ncbi:hypothetical protein LPJ72_005304, partial [Coemansia sp. Benny D160-2]